MTRTSLRRCLAVAAIFILLLAAAPRAHAWGCRGHETVAALAEKHLTPDAKNALMNLLNANPIDPSLHRFCGDTGLDPFVDSSTWADDERNVDPSTGPWHFIDIPLSKQSGNAQDFCGVGGCVLTAITQQVAILKDKTQPSAKRANALRFIIHFVGDLHQPLHAETNGDRGGNCVPVKYFRRKPHVHKNSYTPNLHHLWDTEIPERAMQGAGATEFADTLDTEFSTAFTDWQQGGMQLDAWAWEGHQYAIDTSYGSLGKHIADEPDPQVNSCPDNNNIGQRMLHKHIVIATAYEEQAEPIVEERLGQAGIRLAMILNDAAKGGL